MTEVRCPECWTLLSNNHVSVDGVRPCPVCEPEREVPC